MPTYSFTPFDSSDYQITIDEKIPAKKMADQLFALSASYFINLNINDQDASQKIFADVDKSGLKLQQAVGEHITGKPHSAAKVKYWIDVMQELQKRGEYSLSLSIAMTLSAQSTSKIPGVKEAFQEYQDVINNLDIRGKAKANFYTSPENFVTIPNMILYTSSNETIKNLEKKVKDVPEGEEKQALMDNVTARKDAVQAIANQAHTNLLSSIGTIMPIVEQFKNDKGRLVQALEAYQKKYANSGNEVDRKKYAACEQLLGIINDSQTSDAHKIHLLEGFINFSSNYLEHKGVMKSEFTLTTMSKELRGVLPYVTVYEEISRQNICKFDQFKSKATAVTGNAAVSEKQQQLFALLDSTTDRNSDFLTAILRVVTDIDQQLTLAQAVLNTESDAQEVKEQVMLLNDEQVQEVINVLKEDYDIQLPTENLGM